MNTYIATTLPGGVRVFNATPHDIVFLHEGEELIVQPCGLLVGAQPDEADAHDAYMGEVPPGVMLVATVFRQTAQGLAELETLEAADPEALIVGSIISAQAYPGRVVAMTPAPGFERVAPAEKRMSAVKFTVF